MSYTVSKTRDSALLGADGPGKKTVVRAHLRREDGRRVPVKSHLRGVIGIPDRSVKKPVPDKPGTWLMAIQRHNARKAGEHFDFRLSTDRNAHSWAMRRLPEPGQTVLAKRQPTHTRDYMTWEGTIPSGYGAGDVRLHDKADVQVVDSGPDRVVFNRFDGNKTHEYAMIRPKSDRPDDWLLINRSTTPGKYKVPQYKEPYGENKRMEELVDRPGVLQPKIDGAHAIIVLNAGKRPRAFSYRESKKGAVLEYTHKIPGFFSNRVPAGFGNKVLRGEIYLADKSGKPLPAERTAGILNSGVQRALDLQKGTGGLRVMPFDITSDSRPYGAKLDTINQMARQMPFLTAPPTAVTPDQKRRLVELVASKRHPLTQEGVVHWSLEGRPTKSKNVSDVDVHVRQVFEGTGKHRGSAGGFRYSLTPSGPIVGKVGSGLTDRQRADLWKRRGDLSGRVATIVYEKQTGKGSLFAPRFTRWHPDKDEP